MLKRFDKLEDGVSKCCRPPPKETYASCREIYLSHNFHKSAGNKAYSLNTRGGKIPVYCHMTRNGIGKCGGGGWTLVMKIDGHKQTFHYDSSYWTHKISFNPQGGTTGFDHRQTKLPTYWSTPFSKICLVMKLGAEIRSFVVHMRANSLHSLIADGKYRKTSKGRDTWKSLIGRRASLQKHCNREGFNVMSDSGPGSSKARIGILSNNENNCWSCDSRIGFGTGSPKWRFLNSNTCGNSHGYDAKVQIKTMGYILVQ